MSACKHHNRVKPFVSVHSHFCAMRVTRADFFSPEELNKQINCKECNKLGITIMAQAMTPRLPLRTQPSGTAQPVIETVVGHACCTNTENLSSTVQKMNTPGRDPRGRQALLSACRWPISDGQLNTWTESSPKESPAERSSDCEQA